MTNTNERKLAAIKAMHAEVNAKGIANYTVCELSLRIADLGPVIKSAKWQTAVTRYADFVETEGQNGHLNWAYAQGSVYFGYEVF